MEVIKHQLNSIIALLEAINSKINPVNCQHQYPQDINSTGKRRCIFCGEEEIN